MTMRFLLGTINSEVGGNEILSIIEYVIIPLAGITISMIY